MSPLATGSGAVGVVVANSRGAVRPAAAAAPPSKPPQLAPRTPAPLAPTAAAPLPPRASSAAASARDASPSSRSSSVTFPNSVL
eukprot:39457-Chlamydomonas_euryale.AAC.1